MKAIKTEEFCILSVTYADDRELLEDFITQCNSEGFSTDTVIDVVETVLAEASIRRSGLIDLNANCIADATITGLGVVVGISHTFNDLAPLLVLAKTDLHELAMSLDTVIIDLDAPEVKEFSHALFAYTNKVESYIPLMKAMNPENYISIWETNAGFVAMLLWEENLDDVLSEFCIEWRPANILLELFIKDHYKIYTKPMKAKEVLLFI